MLPRAYVQLQIYNRVFNEWVRIILTPVFFGFGGFVVLFLYAPLAHSELLPGLLSATFAYLAVIVVTIVIWFATDSLEVTRSSESLIMKLQSKHMSRVQYLELGQVELLKRAKALRPVTHPVGNFGNLTLSVPVVFVEEIMSQLLFLRTL